MIGAGCISRVAGEDVVDDCANRRAITRTDDVITVTNRRQPGNLVLPFGACH